MDRDEFFEAQQSQDVEELQSTISCDSDSYASTAATRPFHLPADAESEEDSYSENSDWNSSASRTNMKDKEELPLDVKHRVAMHFPKGKRIELCKNGGWQKAEVLCRTSMLLVQYNNLEKENVARSRARPPPPFMDTIIQFSPGDPAEVLINDTWIPARIMSGKDAAGCLVVVTKSGKFIVKRSNLRRMRKWRGGKWISTRVKKDLENRRRLRYEHYSKRDFDELGSEGSINSRIFIYTELQDLDDDATSSAMSFVSNKRRRT